LFNGTDDAFHATIKRPVARTYAMSTLVEFEPFVDITTKLFIQRLNELFASGASGHPKCNFRKWLQYYAFDVIGEMTFPKPFGFLEHNGDVDGIIASLHQVSMVPTQMPWLDQLLRKNKFRLAWSRPTSPVVAFTQARIQERMSKGKISKPKPVREASTRP
jgi:cytochrome P450